MVGRKKLRRRKRKRDAHRLRRRTDSSKKESFNIMEILIPTKKESHALEENHLREKEKRSEANEATKKAASIPLVFVEKNP